MNVVAREMAVGFCPWCGKEIYGSYISGALVVTFTCECAMRYEGSHRKHVDPMDEYATNAYDGGN